MGGALSVPKKIEAVVGSTGTTINLYNEALSVASGVIDQSVISYTVPIGRTFYLMLVEFSGENIANWSIFVDNIKIGVKRTYFGNSLWGDFFFKNLPVPEGVKIELKVANFRPDPADFEGRILGVLE